MTTITKTLSEIADLKTENERLTEALNSMRNENERLNRMLAGVKPEMMQAKIDTKAVGLKELTGQKAEIYTKPLSDMEKAELARMYQRMIETAQAEQQVLEQDKATLESLNTQI